MNFFKKRKALFGLLGALVIGGGSTAFVMSAVPHSSTGQLSACYRNAASFSDAKGALRVINTESGETCTAQETAVKWPGEKGSLMVEKLKNNDISNSQFSYLNLKGVDLSNSNGTNSSFKGSDLSGANLENTDLNLSMMARVTAVGANFRGSKFSPNESYESNFSGSNFSNAELATVGGNYVNTNLNNAKIMGISHSNFSNADFRTVRFVAPTVDFVDSNLRNANFSGLSLTSRVSFINNDMAGANFSNVTFVSQPADVYAAFAYMSSDKLNNTNFTNTTFKDLSFFQSDLSLANLTNTKWNNVVCPDLTNSDNNGSTCIGHLTP